MSLKRPQEDHSQNKIVQNIAEAAIPLKNSLQEVDAYRNNISSASKTASVPTV